MKSRGIRHLDSKKLLKFSKFNLIKLYKLKVHFLTCTLKKDTLLDYISAFFFKFALKFIFLGIFKNYLDFPTRLLISPLSIKRTRTFGTKYIAPFLQTSLLCRLDGTTDTRILYFAADNMNHKRCNGNAIETKIQHQECASHNRYIHGNTVKVRKLKRKQP